MPTRQVHKPAARGRRPHATPVPRTLERLDRAHLQRAHPPVDLRVTAASGSLVRDARGRTYIDFVMGWCVGNLGWAQQEIRDRLHAFEGPDYVPPAFQYGPWSELAGLLSDLAPGRLTKCVRAVGGSEAVEIALQAAMAATGRHKFVTIEEAYHGNSLGIQLATGKTPFGRTLRAGRTVKPPLDAQALARVETALKGRDVAAFLMEPVICNLGALVPSERFMTGLRELCDKYGTLLVLDEVACGIGRTGKLFATEHFDVAPDILTLGKAITGGHAPLAATLLTQEVADRAGEDLHVYSTFGWHPLAVEAALANLRYIQKHKAALLRNVDRRSAQFRGRLDAMDFGDGSKVRVKGLAIGVQLADRKHAKRIEETCREEGLLVKADDDVLQMFPALTIDQETADGGLDILERCL
ncbi:MAG: acetylornithine/N-succinyldiaminopimelate aminotransferase [Thermoplasmata archaeon]|jgi:acetylornithine/succinyldiaminopimelate/putrescine aminotransferase|nr:acetylornithine/N-succinyldiaminopimelate aminotransferase [Thermoplasmata archaeon]